MKKQMRLTLILANLLIIPSLYSQVTVFEGVIKYVALNGDQASLDSMIVYFGKNKIKIVRTGTLVEKFGGVVEELVDFEKNTNQTTIKYSHNRDIEVINSSKSGISSIKYYPDSIKTILGFICTKVDLIFETSEFGGGIHTLIVSNWNTSISCLSYIIPDSAHFSQFHTNYSKGGIPLRFTRTVHSLMNDGSERVKSTEMVACELTIKKLTDTVFQIP